LEAAIEAGKAARNTAIVPEIEELREVGDGRYRVEVGENIVTAVGDAVKKKAIDPIVERCVEKLTARGYSDEIERFRHVAIAVGEKREEVNRLIHEPTKILRSGGKLDDYINNLRNNVNLGEAMLLRNVAQIGSFNSAEEQFDQLEDDDKEILLAHDENCKKLDLLEKVVREMGQK